METSNLTLGRVMKAITVRYFAKRSRYAMATTDSYLTSCAYLTGDQATTQGIGWTCEDKKNDIAFDLVVVTKWSSSVNLEDEQDNICKNSAEKLAKQRAGKAKKKHGKKANKKANKNGKNGAKEKGQKEASGR
jgi:hypothetical protein